LHIFPFIVFVSVAGYGSFWIPDNLLLLSFYHQTASVV
jgi:hypothetical protein